MEAKKPLVVLSILGTKLDRARRGPDRWRRWRPTVALALNDAVPMARLELIHTAEWDSLARSILSDVVEAQPLVVGRGHALAFPDPWDFQAVYGALFDFARAYPFDPEAEDYLVHITTGTHVQQICLFLLVESGHIPARLLQSSPGESPAGLMQVIDLSLDEYDALRRRFEEEKRDAATSLKGGIETRNPAFNAMIMELERVALGSDAPILLTGPTGAGKSALARRIYELKRARHRVRGRLVEVNCATLRGDGAMSALFGHKRGAFTGSVADRAGLLREADGGLLFLDEVGELGLDEQAMLLRAIEQKRFLPVGADREVESAFMLIAGTNRDLQAEVGRGAFREDLLARLDLWTFRLPGLAERAEDLAPNLDFELARVSRLLGRAVVMRREAREAFLRFGLKAPWTRNFRDLSGAVERMATLAQGGRIAEADVEAELGRLVRAWGSAAVGPVVGAASEAGAAGGVAGLPGELALLDGLDRFDASQLADVLVVCRACASLSEAGRVLFAVSRTQRSTVNDADRLRKYLARFGLDWERARGG